MTSVLSVFFKHKEGGFNKRLYELYIGLASRGVHVHYVAVEKFPVEHRNITAHVLSLPFRQRENYLFWVLFIMTAPVVLLYLAKKHRAELFVVFEPFYACLCIPAKLLFGKPIATFIRSNVAKEYEMFGKPRLQRVFNRVIEKIGYRFSKKVFPNSNQLAKVLCERNSVDSSRIFVIPNNVRRQVHAQAPARDALRLEYGIGEDEFVIVTVSVFNEKKNISFLIKCFSKARLANGRLLIIGDAIGQDKDRRARLEEEAAIMGVQDRTIFAGWLQDPQRLLAGCNVFVMPSKEEGSPNALLEALGCSIPCLGSRIPEIEEVLQHRELLFSLSSEQELTEKLSKAAADSSYYAKICRLSMEQMERFAFDWEEVVFEQISSTLPYSRLGGPLGAV